MENIENTQNRPKNSFFLPNGGRAEVLGELTGMMGRADSISAVVGASGTGKTALCHTLAENIDGDLHIFYFACPPHSFEDFLVVLADKLGCNNEDSAREQNEQSNWLHCVEQLTSSFKKNIFIFDDAHRIYLATLERIIKFISECKAQKAEVHLILAGEPQVVEAWQSLAVQESLCGDLSVFTLNKLDKKDTGLFYQGVRDSCTEAKKTAALSAEMLERLYEITDGNMTEIHHVAQGVAVTDGGDAAFISLLNNIEGEGSTDARLKRKIAKKKKEYAQKRGRLFLLTGLIFCIVGGAFYWWYPSSDGVQSRTTIAPVETEQKDGMLLSAISSADEETISVVAGESGSAAVITIEKPVSITEVADVDETKVVENKQLLVSTDLPATEEETVLLITSAVEPEPSPVVSEVADVDETKVVEVRGHPSVVENKQLLVSTDLPATEEGTVLLITSAVEPAPSPVVPEVADVDEVKVVEVRVQPSVVEEKQPLVSTDLPVTDKETVSLITSAVKVESSPVVPEVADVDEKKVVEVRLQPVVVEEKHDQVVTDLPMAREIIVIQGSSKTAVAAIVTEENLPIIKNQSRKIIIIPQKTTI